MENNLEQDIEIQLQEELKRIKKIVEYIEHAKTIYAQSQQIYDNTQTKFAEMSNFYESLKQTFQKSISEIENKTNNIQISLENKFINQFSSIQQDIHNLSKNKKLVSDINNIKSELSNQQKSFEISVNNLNSKIANLSKQIRISKIFNYILLILLIVSLIITIINYR